MDGHSNPTPDVLQVGALEMLADQLEEGFDGLVVRFRQRLEETPAAIQAAWEAEQRTEMAREAHSLKSVAATFGAVAVSRTSAELEVLSGAGTREELEEIIGRLDHDCGAARSAIDEWSAGRRADPADSGH